MMTMEFVATWLRVLVVAGLLTAFAERLYGNALGLLGVFCLYVLLGWAYIYHEVLAFRLVEWLSGR